MNMNGTVFAKHSYKDNKWVLSTLSQQPLSSEIACEYVDKVESWLLLSGGFKMGNDG